MTDMAMTRSRLRSLASFIRASAVFVTPSKKPHSATQLTGLLKSTSFATAGRSMEASPKRVSGKMAYPSDISAAAPSGLRGP